MIVAIYSNIAVFVQVFVGSVGYSILYIVIFRLTLRRGYISVILTVSFPLSEISLSYLLVWMVVCV